MKNVCTLLDKILYLLNIQAKALNTYSLLKKNRLSLPDWKVTVEIKCRGIYWCWNILSTCHFVQPQKVLSIRSGGGAKFSERMGASYRGR
jgi:hypothetical protein